MSQTAINPFITKIVAALLPLVLIFAAAAGLSFTSAPAASAQTIDLLNNFNTDGTINGPLKATVFTLNHPAVITELITYHWNSGKGAAPGTIALRNQRGKIYGPFAPIGSSGQGGAPNVDWTARANVTLPPGTYTVIDSSPRTWSNNSQSGFAGFAKVRGHFTGNAGGPAPKPPVSQTNLIQNGSFEIGSEPGALTVCGVGATNIAHWRITDGTIDYIGSYWSASHGKRSVDLDGTPGPGAIAQSFATTPGQEYIVAFDLSGNSEGAPPVKRLEVSAAGQSMAFSFDTRGNSANAMGWQRQTWRFRANATQTTLEFRSLGAAGSSYGPVIDNVSVVAVR